MDASMSERLKALTPDYYVTAGSRTVKLHQAGPTSGLYRYQAVQLSDGRHLEVWATEAENAYKIEDAYRARIGERAL